MSASSRRIDRLQATFDHDGIVANAGLIVPATLMVRLGLEALIDAWVKTGSALPGRKVLTLVAAMLVGATQRVLPFRVMAPSTIGTFLRSFTFGHVRQLDAVLSRVLGRAWDAGAGPGSDPLVVDLDSTICEVHGNQKQGAAYGYTKKLGYHPLLATRAGTGEMLFARMRRGSANTARGIVRFVNELVANLKRAGSSGPIGRPLEVWRLLLGDRGAIVELAVVGGRIASRLARDRRRGPTEVVCGRSNAETARSTRRDLFALGEAEIPA